MMVRMEFRPEIERIGLDCKLTALQWGLVGFGA